MTDTAHKKLVQSEINFRTKQAKKDVLIGKISSGLIAGMAVLGLLSSVQNLKNKDEKLKTAAAVLFLGWAYMRHLNLKTNAQNKLIYNSLNANNKTSLNEEKKFEVMNNVVTAGLTYASSGLSVFIPIVACGCNQMSLGTGSCACAGILIAGETYIKNRFDTNNRLLKSELPKGVLLPNFTKERE